MAKMHATNAQQIVQLALQRLIVALVTTICNWDILLLDSALAHNTTSGVPITERALLASLAVLTVIGATRTTTAAVLAEMEMAGATNVKPTGLGIPVTIIATATPLVI